MTAAVRTCTCGGCTQTPASFLLLVLTRITTPPPPKQHLPPSSHLLAGPPLLPAVNHGSGEATGKEKKQKKGVRGLVRRVALAVMTRVCRVDVNRACHKEGARPSVSPLCRADYLAVATLGEDEQDRREEKLQRRKAFFFLVFFLRSLSLLGDFLLQSFFYRCFVC